MSKKTGKTNRTIANIEDLSDFVVGFRDGMQMIVDACNVFLKHIEKAVLEIPEDPETWNKLEWEQREKNGFEFEMLRIDESNSLHRQLRILIKQKQGLLITGDYRYSVGRDNNVIFRSNTKEKK